MDESVFRFKKFTVSHAQSSMKVGVDAVLLGAWAGMKASRILDIGTGSGVIALMMAQRFPESRILGIDIDQASVEEAEFNFSHSPWSDRLTVKKESFPEDLINKVERFDLIVSNPPYFNSGIINPTTPREKARHQDKLSVFSILKHAKSLITEGGVIALIYPEEFHTEAKLHASNCGLVLIRQCFVRGNINRPFKRVIAEFKNTKSAPNLITEFLTLHQDNKPTEEYIKLCRNFYLKF